MRAINLTLVPLGVLVALVGVLAASFNAFAQQEGTPSTIWAIVMVALGLGGASLLLAFEGFVLRRRARSSNWGPRPLGVRRLGPISTTLALVVLGLLFVVVPLPISLHNLLFFPGPLHL